MRRRCTGGLSLFGQVLDVVPWLKNRGLAVVNRLHDRVCVSGNDGEDVLPCAYFRVLPRRSGARRLDGYGLPAESSLARVILWLKVQIFQAGVS